MARERDAFELALGALSRRERSVAELSVWLAERGVEGVDLEETIGALIESGGLDDERFALAFAADKREISGWGGERIRAALSERGIDAELIDHAVAAGGDHATEVERAVGLLVRRDEPLDDDPARARALGFLARRGYDHETAYAAVRAFRAGQLDSGHESHSEAA